MENSKIEWCDNTFNPWIGCTLKSPGCKNCYAWARDKRFAGGIHWGPGAPRKRTTEDNWKQPLKWNEAAIWADIDHNAESNFGKDLGPYVRPRVFCASLADWLDEEVCCQWFVDLLRLIHDTPNLDWLLLTKRPENWMKRMVIALNLAWGVPQVETPFAVWVEKWLTGQEAPSNVWIGTTVEDQARADERLPLIVKIPARVRFLSCEPLLEPVSLAGFLPKPKDWKWFPVECRHGHDACPICDHNPKPQDSIQWVICGGESGPDARPMHPDWARSLRNQCQSAEVPFLFKQWGEWQPYKMGTAYMKGFRQSTVVKNGEGATGWPVYHVGKVAAGRLLDDREWNEFPKVEVPA